MKPEHAKISPSGGLILEVLAARHRLGEPFWTFSSIYAWHLRRLQNDGLVEVESGITYRTRRVSLTERGRAAVLADAYQPPMPMAADIYLQVAVGTNSVDPEEAASNPTFRGVVDATRMPLLLEIGRLKIDLARREEDVSKLLECHAIHSDELYAAGQKIERLEAELIERDHQ